MAGCRGRFVDSVSLKYSRVPFTTARTLLNRCKLHKPESTMFRPFPIFAPDSAPPPGTCCLLLQYLIQSCAHGGRRIVEDMCYEIR
jgi:hypothetical protein